MYSDFQRYAVALLFFTVVVVLMLFGTLAVKDFGDKMFEDLNVTMHPKGEHIEL